MQKKTVSTNNESSNVINNDQTQAALLRANESYEKAQSDLSQLGKRRQASATVTRPSDGAQLTVSLERVNPTDYWGRRVQGVSPTYTLYIMNDTTGDREYYNYGMSLSDAKNEVSRRTGIRIRTSRR